jgi:serine phosphatase RsbU (regulator of sigma subunit)
MAVLQVITGTEPGQCLALNADRSVMGRHPECDIVLDSAAVSRQHACIIREGSDFYIEDMHSRNGTFVNGSQIQGRRLLQDGDQLRICELTFAFFTREPSSELLGTAMLGAEGLPLPLLVDDGAPTGTIMSKVDVSSGKSPLLSANPEVKLRAMIEISQSLGKTVALEAVLPKLLESLFKIFPQADRGFVVLRSGPNGPLVPRAIRYRREHMEERVRISRTILDQVIASKEAILSADATSDTRFETSQSIADLRIRSVMCVPLIDSEGQPLGAMQIDTLDPRHRFRQEDLDVLASVASQAAIAVDNAQLHENALKQLGVQRDLELAHKVQRGLLPSHPPHLPGYFFFDFYESANQVGGDYYDYIELPGPRLAVVLGDVSGKGVSAALLMAKLSGEVRYCLAGEPDPALAVKNINTSFCRAGWDDRFVTFILALIDPQRNQVSIVNAGHMPPYVRRVSGEVDSLGGEEAGVPLGVDADYPYEQCVHTILPGECLVLFTDGISEAMNAANELYGLARLRQQVGAPDVGVPQLGRRILENVRQFVGGQPQSDDMCLTCFGRNP